MKKKTDSSVLSSSKIRRINIELANYKFFHSPSLIEQNDRRFVGRDQTIEHLRSILTNNETNTGSYLITGYRGMGKSSYVNKVLNQITLKQKRKLPGLLLYPPLFLIFYMILLTIPFFKENVGWSLIISLSFLFLWWTIAHFAILRSILTFIRIFFKLDNRKARGYLLHSRLFAWKNSFLRKNIISKEYYRKRKRVTLSLNLGHEILNEKDILSLISKNIEKEFKRFAYSIRRQTLFYLLKSIILLFMAYQIINTHPVSQRFYDHILFTQSKSFQDKFTSDSISSNYTGLIQQIKDDSLKKKAHAFVILENNRVEIYRKGIPRFLEYSGHALKKWINTADVYLDWSYCYVSYRINELLPGFVSKYFKFPAHLNYLFFFTLFLLNFTLTFLSQLVLRSNYSRFTSRKVIIRKLRQLNDHIDAAVKTELSSGVTTNDSKIGFNFNQRRAKEYPIAGVRQIEKSLIDIFDSINNLLPCILKPEFIIVFDELDKIDPRTNTNINDKEEELTDFDHSASGFPGGATNRLRKQNVLRLLANMKYFITTAKAKFIFIAGRELYDAFLADVSDREFSISSIFHEVIYVESFLSESSDGNRSDITSMTEHYVCQFLMPEWFILYQTCLKKGNRYEALTLKTYENYLNSELKSKEFEIKKTIMQLYQFVHYLTHVSNGAPKKITNLFERHVIPSSYCDKSANIFIGSKSARFYLSFSYLDQCKIGFIHYLANPIMMSVINNVRTYGDKLLVSASFLIDHIYKFHRNGFSWRNLEHAPEILDINRTPELRNFISVIISYLTQTHISPIVAGLYVFKFPKKISEEISFISKISEEASAIFNFTLDESLTVKRYYSKLLRYYTTQYHEESQRRKSGNDEFIRTIADIHHILGDLRFADEEYTEAIFEYQSCVQYIAPNFKGTYNDLHVTHLLFIVRTQLKLGLVYEKRKTFNSAYLTYCELVSKTIDFRHIDEKQFGLEYRIYQEGDWAGPKAILYRKKFQHDNNDNFRKEIMPEQLISSDEKNMIFSAHGDELIPALAKITTPLKNKLITRLSLFEDVRLMYQAILAKLFVLEKQHLGGISPANLKVAEGEFLNLHLATNLKDKFLISADFFKKLGDILFYKNGLINNESHYLFNGLYFWDYNVEDNIDHFARENVSLKKDLLLIKRINFGNIEEYIQSASNEPANTGSSFDQEFRESVINYLEELEKQEKIDEKEIDPLLRNEFKRSLSGIKTFFYNKTEASPNTCCIKGMDWTILAKVKVCNNRRHALLKEMKITPCFACKYYNRSLKILADNLLNESRNDWSLSKALIFLQALDQHQTFYSYRSNFNQILAATLGGFGDILVSCSMAKDHIRKEFLHAFFTYMSDENKGNRYNALKSKIEGLHLFNLEKSMLYYLASAKYYKRSSNLKEAHIFYKKILLLLIQYIASNPDQVPNVKDHLDSIRDEITRRIIQCIYSAYEHIHTVEIQKLKWINTKQMYELLDLNQLSLFPELEETLYASYELELLCDHIEILPGEKNGYDQTRDGEISIKKLYNLQALSPYRLNSSIYNRLISLRFKALLNRKIFEKMIEGYVFNSDVYDPRHPILFYAKLHQTLEKLGNPNEETALKQLFLINPKEQEAHKSPLLASKALQKSFLSAVEHLIADSIFCLQKFVEVVYPHNKTTLFTHSFTADIYRQLFEWTQLFDFLFMLYAYMDDQYDNKKIKEKESKIRKKLAGHCLQRYAAQQKLSPESRSINEKFLVYLFSFKEEISSPDLVRTNMIEDLNTDGIRFAGFKNLFQKRAKHLFDHLYFTIGKNNTHMTDCNYLAEMAIKKYQQAFSTHREGKPYKNMIDEMYYLNDDLDNDTFKFLLALERYQINADKIKSRMNNLKNVYSNSTLFEIDKYIN